MEQAARFEYSNKELVTMMIKAQGIHDGHWALQLKLSFSAMNVGQSPDGSDAAPSGIVAVTGVSIERVDQSVPFAVNAADVNPKK